MNIKTLIKNIIQWKKEKEIIPIDRVVSENNQFYGKVAFITGGTGGIGLAIAKELLNCGCKVIIAGTNQNKIDDLISGLSGEIRGIIFNLNDIASFKEKLNEVVMIYGKIDIFINSAGVHTENLDFWKLTPMEYDRVMNINLKGPYFLSLEIANYMKANSIKGHFLYVTSSRGSEPAWSPYGLSKWGMNGLIKGLAMMLLPNGIIVNGIAPGSTATALLGKSEGDSIYTNDNKVGRMATPDEIAYISKMLVSGTGDMIIGEIVHVSGGRGTIDIR